jgi:hypothetical protein
VCIIKIIRGISQKNNNGERKDKQRELYIGGAGKLDPRFNPDREWVQIFLKSVKGLLVDMVDIPTCKNKLPTLVLMQKFY